MRVIIHIGTHKTGSTALQMSLSRSKGFLYPKSGRPPQHAISFGHHLLPWSLTRGHDLKAWDDLDSEMSGSRLDKVVLSSEEFDTLNEDQIDFVASRLPDAEVVMYLRRQDKFVQSMYCTDVVFSEYSGTIFEYIEALRTEVNYFELYNKWNRRFKVTAIPYERNALKNKDVISDFAYRYKLRLATTGDKVNTSFPKHIIDLIVNMRKMGNKPSEVKELIRLADYIYTKNKISAPINVFSPTEARGYFTKFEDSNAQLASLSGHDQLFSDDNFGDQAAWDAAYLRPYAALIGLIRDCTPADMPTPFWDTK